MIKLLLSFYFMAFNSIIDLQDYYLSITLLLCQVTFNSIIDLQRSLQMKLLKYLLSFNSIIDLPTEK